MKKIVAITIGTLLISSMAMAQVRLKENKDYIRWNDTSTDITYKSDPDPRKAGWQYRENRTRVYEEVENNKQKKGKQK